MVNLETTYMGLKLKNPLIAASSGLTNSVGKIMEMEGSGIAGVVLKSIFEEQILNEIGQMIASGQSGMEYPEAVDYMNTYLRENSISQHLTLLKEAKAAVNIPVIASINCVSPNEWTTFAKEFEEAGADAIELNVFYLPANRNTQPGEIEQMYLTILEKIKEEVKIPVAIKIGMYFTNIVAMTDKLKASGANAVVLFNRFYEPDINLKTLEIVASEVFSSPADLRRSLRWVGLVSSSVPHLEIAASTGIHNGDAVIKELLAGAQVTQLCSTIYQNGPGVISQILKDLKSFMQKWNFKNIDEFRGRLSYKNIPDPMLYERSQFMKYFSGNH